MIRFYKIIFHIILITIAFSCEKDNKQDCTKIIYSDSLSSYENFDNKEGYIKDEKTAIAIATAVWLSFYGENIYKSKPFKATLINDSIWYVRGAIIIDTCNRKNITGPAHIEINKNSGKILRMIYDR